MEAGHTGRSVKRRPRASLRRAVRTSFVRTDGSYCELNKYEGGTDEKYSYMPLARAPGMSYSIILC